MPFVKTSWTRTPNAYVLNALSSLNISPIVVGAGSPEDLPQAWVVIPAACKIAKVGVAYAGYQGTISLNITYLAGNLTIGPSISGFNAYNVAPNDNSTTGGVTASTAGASLVSPNVTPIAVNNGTPGFPNPALTTAYPALNQQGGLGIPTNFAVSGQTVFYGMVDLATYVPGAGSGSMEDGGWGILYPANTDAVYPSGPNAYAGAVYPQLANATGLFALNVHTSSGEGDGIGGLSVTIFCEPISMAQAVEPQNLQVIPGVNF